MDDDLRSTVLLFVRHGRARSADRRYGNRTPLDRFGREQARAVAAAFGADEMPTAVYTSPYPRAVATAEPLCGRRGIAPVVEARLAEFELPPAGLREVRRRPDLVLWRPCQRGAPGGETLAQFSGRMAGLCEDVARRHLGTSVALFTHSGVIDAALRWSVGLGADGPWQHDFDIATASVTEIEVWPDGRVTGGAPRYCGIRRVGDVRHLGNLVSEL